MGKKVIKYSTNELAEKIVGKRPEVNGIMFDQPCELGYHCPKCKYKHTTKGEFDCRLHWSEYNGFLWCSVCNKDYPSALCQPDIDKAIETYLTSVLDAKKLKVRFGFAPLLPSDDKIKIQSRKVSKIEAKLVQSIALHYHEKGAKWLKEEIIKQLGD